MKQIYSVYDYRTKQYRYYTTPLGTLPATGSFRAPRTISGAVIPESVATRLPADAVPAGTGVEARGLIASPLGEVASDSTGDTSNRKLFVAVGVLGVLWWLWRRK